MSQYQQSQSRPEEMPSSPPTSPVAAFLELRKWLARANQASATLGQPAVDFQLIPAMSMDDMRKAWDLVRKALSTTDRQAQQASAAQVTQAEIAKFKTRLSEVTGFEVPAEDEDTQEPGKVSPQQIDGFMKRLRDRRQSLGQLVQDARSAEIEELRAQATAALSRAGRPTRIAEEATTVGRLRNILSSPDKYGREEGDNAGPKRFAGHDDLCFAGVAKKDGAGAGKDRIHGINLEVSDDFLEAVVNPLLRKEFPRHCGIEMSFWRRENSTIKMDEDDLQALRPGDVVCFRCFLHTKPDGTQAYHCELGGPFGDGKSKGKFVLLRDHPQGWLMEAITDSYTILPTSSRSELVYEAAPRLHPLDAPRRDDSSDHRSTRQVDRRSYQPQRRGRR